MVNNWTYVVTCEQCGDTYEPLDDDDGTCPHCEFLNDEQAIEDRNG